MSGPSRYLHPTTPGGLLSTVQGLLTASETLVVQAITTGTYFVFNEIPSGVAEGATVLTLAHTPNPASSLEIRVQDMWLSPTAPNDYTVSGNIITLTNPLPPNPVVYCNYTVSPV